MSTFLAARIRHQGSFVEIRLNGGYSGTEGTMRLQILSMIKPSKPLLLSLSSQHILTTSLPQTTPVQLAQEVGAGK
eukprot:5620265-Pleurochrysis_carterae.AAC.1